MPSVCGLSHPKLPKLLKANPEMICRFDSHHFARSIISKVFHFVLVLMCSASGHLSLNGAISGDFLCSLMSCLLKTDEARFPCFYPVLFTPHSALDFSVTTGAVYFFFQFLAGFFKGHSGINQKFILFRNVSVSNDLCFHA